MTKAEEAALKAYPVDYGPAIQYPECNNQFDFNECFREKFQEGYEQALKDLMKDDFHGDDKFKAGDKITYHGNGYEITGVDDKWYKVKADIPSQIPELEINAISKDNEKDIKRQE